jgi:hypothetical protein
MLINLNSSGGGSKKSHQVAKVQKISDDKQIKPASSHSIIHAQKKLRRINSRKLEHSRSDYDY